MPKKEKIETKKAETKRYFVAVGRRKTAIATVRLYPSSEEVIVNDKKLEKGEIYVNGKTVEQYFVGPYAKAIYQEIFKITGTEGKFIITAVVAGSGTTGQLGAVSLAISRALCVYDPKHKVLLRKKGFMTRDPRAKERKKPGLPGARKKKSSPKR